MYAFISLAKTCLVMLVLLQCAAGFCQSLGDIARAYRAKPPAKKAVRVYTVDDFYPGEAPKPKPPSMYRYYGSTMSSSSASEVTSSSTIQSSSGYTASASVSDSSSGSSSTSSSGSSSSSSSTGTFFPSYTQRWCPPHQHRQHYRPQPPEPPKPPPMAVKYYY